ncbi:hypothetical protein BDW69DRAFT_157150 [Aspergillus filifer]
MVDFTLPTKPNTRIPPILLARKHQTQPSISTSLSTSQPEQATHLINLSQKKLSAEANNADPSLRRCLAHHRLLTKSIFEAKSDMRVYLDEIVEYESDSEDDEDEDEDAVFDEHVEVVGMFHRDNDNVTVVDEENEAKAMLLHEEGSVQHDEVFLAHPDTHPSRHLTPPPGLPVPSGMAVSLPMPMPVSTYAPTSTASTLTHKHKPRSKTPRASFSSKLGSDDDDDEGDASKNKNKSGSTGAVPCPGASAGGVSDSLSRDSATANTSPIPNQSRSSPHGTRTAATDELDERTPDTIPASLLPRPSLSSLPTSTTIDRTSSAPTPTPTSKSAHPIKDKIVNTVKGLVKRRNSSPSCLPKPSIESISASSPSPSTHSPPTDSHSTKSSVEYSAYPHPEHTARTTARPTEGKRTIKRKRIDHRFFISRASMQVAALSPYG